MKNKVHVYLPLIIFLFFCACSSPTRYYKLGIDGVNITTEHLVNNKIYALRNLELPEYLDNQYLIYFENCCQINRDEKRLWQDEIKDNVRRYLHNRLGGYDYPLPHTISADIVRDIKIIDLIAYKEKGAFYAQVFWQISDIKNATSKSGKFEKSYPLDFKREGLEERLVKLYKKALDEIALAILSNQ